MFALYVEHADGSREFLTTVDNHAWALIHGKVYSRERNVVVVGVYNDSDGDTQETFRFISGAPAPGVPMHGRPPSGGDFSGVRA